MSSKILAQRSAVPAVLSRTTPNPLKRKVLTHSEKDRLLRVGKRPRKGPFNAIMDPTEVGAGSALLEVSEAAKNSGTYNVWEAIPALGATVKVRFAFLFCIRRPLMKECSQRHLILAPKLSSLPSLPRTKARPTTR